MRKLASLVLFVSFNASAQLIDPSGILDTGTGTIKFTANDGNNLKAYTYRDSGFDPKNGRILFVMHGQSRNADDYRDRAQKYVAEDYAALVVAPEFPTSKYPGSNDYTLNSVNYETIESLFDDVVSELGGEQNGYYIYGHSAGGQFVHRLMTFSVSNRAVSAVAANPGWWTTARRDVKYPYGLKDTTLERADIGHLLSANMTVMLGAEDTESCYNDSSLRCTSEARDQGINRLERGQYYFAVGEDVAAAEGKPFGWSLAIIPGVEHSSSGTLREAGPYLFEEVTTPTSEPEQEILPPTKQDKKQRRQRQRGRR